MWTKLSSLDIDIFSLKMTVKSGLNFLFQNSASPYRVAAAQCSKICPIFTIIFKSKKGNLKAQDFIPLIERALACVVNTDIM